MYFPLFWHCYLYFSESHWWGRMLLNPRMLAASDWMDCTKPTKQCCDPPWELSLWNSILDSLHRLSVSGGYSLSRNAHIHTRTKASYKTACRPASNKSCLILSESAFLQWRHNASTPILLLPMINMTSAASCLPTDQPTNTVTTQFTLYEAYGRFVAWDRYQYYQKK